MAENENPSVGEFGASFKGFMEQMAAQAPAEDPVFLTRLRTHFSTEAVTFPIVAEEFEPSDHPNVQRAIDAYISERNCTTQLIGITGDQMFAYGGGGLAQIIKPAASGLWGGPPTTEGPVQYVNIALEDDQVIACVQCGLYLIGDGQRRLAVLVNRPNDMGMSRKVKVEVMAVDRSLAEAFLAELRVLIRKRNVFRSRVLSLSIDQREGTKVQFHRLPAIAPDQIILPAGLLARIERQTIGFGKHSTQLLAMGRHLKRGLLLHGRPGTGKTLTAMYLASQMRERTVLLLTGRGMGLIEQSCAMARLLQPSIVILEDVDLIAEERTREGACAAVLFELLNQMDGLADDADILFLLTTNRPDILEPALASRPGRIDQAIEVPLPDAECRRRLFELYGRGLILKLDQLDRFIAKTEGASAAFIRELLRKSALFATDETADSPVIMDRHVDEALHELVVAGGELTKSLLGVR
jgi:ATPase family associated with various cellular activities (AAA)